MSHGPSYIEVLILYLLPNQKSLFAVIGTYTYLCKCTIKVTDFEISGFYYKLLLYT